MVSQHYFIYYVSQQTETANREMTFKKVDRKVNQRRTPTQDTEGKCELHK